MNYMIFWPTFIQKILDILIKDWYKTVMDVNEPIEIAEDIYWVGYDIPNDPFQCHAYLINNKDESVLIDPGSKLTYEVTRKKILKITELKNIKYFICHHQDPDIVACMQDIFDEIGTENRYVVTHWRAWALLKHYNWNVKLYEVEEHMWKLKLESRLLRFIFTPYMHFSGAFCTYDTKTKVLFSSDIFGGFTDKFELYAKSADYYFEKMKPFHEHYMPSSAIVNHGLDNIEQYKPINLIAPQHGSIIKKEYIDRIMSQLRQLKCGLFEDFNNTNNVRRISDLNSVLDEIIRIISYNESFFKVIDRIITSLNKFYNIDYIKVYLADDSKKEIIVMDSQSSTVSVINDDLKAKNMINIANYLKEGAIFYQDSSFHLMFDIKDICYIFPVKDIQGEVQGVCCIALDNNNVNIKEDLEIMKKFEILISMAALKERDIFLLENQNRELYSESIKDALTGLFNRKYMNMFLHKELERSKRFNEHLSAVMFDIDHFKNVNDTYGHLAGDIVLKKIAQTMKNAVRSIDIPIRYGGEEFLLILPNTGKRNAYIVAEKIRKNIEDAEVKYESHTIKYTISAGVSSSEDGAEKNMNQLILLADQRLYKAKESGRNRVVSD